MRKTKTKNRNGKMKLFYVSGVRHSAIVIANHEDEAIKLAIKEDESKKDKENLEVLYGSAGKWESPEAKELKLPRGIKIIAED